MKSKVKTQQCSIKKLEQHMKTFLKDNIESHLESSPVIQKLFSVVCNSENRIHNKLYALMKAQTLESRKQKNSDSKVTTEHKLDIAINTMYQHLLKMCKKQNWSITHFQYRSKVLQIAIFCTPEATKLMQNYEIAICGFFLL
jgi:predicted nucleotidyltransferase